MKRVWLGGLLLGLVVLGPGLQPGGLLSLDLVVGPRIPVPAEMWGSGFEFPRRVPYGVVLALLSRVFGGPLTVKVTIVLAVAAAFAGVYRLAASTPVLARVGAGTLYALSPFTLTRIGAGHIGLLLAVAVLPWALPSLLVPNAEPRRTLRWAAAMGFCGFAGGTLALLVLFVGVVAERGRGWVRVAILAVVSQLPWVVSGLVAAFTLEGVRAAGGFETRVGAVLDLAAGQGFWRAGSQVGFEGPASTVFGAVLVVLAGLGWRDLPAPWGRRAAVAAAAGFVIAAASGIPGLDAVHEASTSSMPGLLVRESQRVLVLFLVWMAPAAAAGATRLASTAGRARPVYLAVPAAVAAVLAAPGLWGVDGRLGPVDFPEGWQRTRRVIADDPGPVLALPWHRYMDISFANGRRVLNPLPDYLDADVITSFDPELGPGGEEGADPRADALGPVRRALQRGQPVADALAANGVRWVVLLHEVEWRRDAALADDPGLDHVVRSDDIDLFAVPNARLVEGGRDPVRPWPVGLVSVACLVNLCGVLWPDWAVVKENPLRYRHSGRC